MVKIGYHISHEQFSPKDLLAYTQIAAKSGFGLITSSDHFHPWSESNSHSGFAWSWLGAAMQAVDLEFGIVTSPAPRYHPAIIAQAVATLNQMFANRLWIAAGSGQAMNENISGVRWPDKATRNSRLEESVAIMRRLWNGEEVTAHGHIKVVAARLYTLPTAKPKVFGAALSEQTAAWLAPWSDGIITVNHPDEKLQKVVAAFQAGNPAGEMAIKVQVSYAENLKTAEQLAWEGWKNNILGGEIQAELSHPKHFDEAARFVRKEDMKQHVLISTQPAAYIDMIKKYIAMGFTKITLHNVNRDQENFLQMMRQEVLPTFSHH
ncbi:TIGR03885 family FMN-dependent LLM class oxidoreductase [Sphingobacterium oryzagri]|uniref:TIGR03885 family FMN-dependent LLM class oxidoreductase n=1 Tax=Sphingobacterium oryzagri TaxID=3025669 RepID=A0ABY7WB22_9SPHI|nr:TIGR03885 family FMN-dependent LLM class oxidoreductase [Sphingobacterium sp. KACC 22765]WDF66856.1 TIGR03885 family FMN-dependent LLM class oxidoreductase [Sphingobacterium sp. KACC 22765]